jgi:hypothetical protein
VFFSAIALLKFAMTVEGEVGGANDDLPEVGSSGFRVEKREHDDKKIETIAASALKMKKKMLFSERIEIRYFKVVFIH